MVNWESPETIQRDLHYAQFTIVFCLGVYLWEFLLTFSFEMDLITGRLPFKWPYIPYLLGRYVFLSLLVLLVFVKESTTPFDCQGTYKAIALLSNMTIGCASTNLTIRTMLIWRKSWAVRLLLAIVSLGLWGFVVFAGATDFVASWNSPLRTCTITRGGHSRLAGFYLYTMLYDLIILILTIVGLSRERVRSYLFEHLYRQGVAYFGITFAVNVIPLVFAWLNLNSVMNVISSIPAAGLSIIASSRSVLSLLSSDDYHSESVFGRTRFFLWIRPPLTTTTTRGEDTVQLTTRISLPLSLTVSR